MEFVVDLLILSEQWTSESTFLANERFQILSNSKEKNIEIEDSKLGSFHGITLLL